MRTLLKVVTLAAAAVIPMTAGAQDYPDKPVNLIVPYPPGGNVDSAARVIAPHLEEKLGQPFVIENRSGASGMIAAEHVKNADPDGYTIFVAANGPLLFSPLTMGRPDAYDWKTDFEAIGSISLTPMVMTARSELEIDSLDELLERADSEDLLMASPGAGTTNHLAAELLREESGGDWRIVHYKGNSPSMAALLGGETHFSFDQLSVILPQIREGELTPLAVTSSERVPSLPEVPTLQETGVVDFQAVTFTGLLAPAGTPEPVIDTLSTALQETLEMDSVKERFEELGAVSSPMTKGEFVELLTDIDDTWRPVIKQMNESQ